jgi:hypothetical protein
MRNLVAVLSLLCTASALLPASALACGGFFCSSTPVDQNAERVVFKIRDDGKTDMVVQITYQGNAEDFAWILPLASPPAKEDLGIFPQMALTSLDAQTGVSVQQPCAQAVPITLSGGGGSADNDASGSLVEIFVRAQIGNYDVAVIGSSDAEASATWLRDNGFRISEPMLGFIRLYTNEGMKFLALKLLPDKAVSDITPFKLTLPGDTPSIPLRLSAVAAEPEMGIVTWILGKQRYEPANAQELSIRDEELRFDQSTFQSNWTTLVARAVDAAHGRGFVVEDAQLVEPLRIFASSSATSSPAQEEAKRALLELFANTTYVTRLVTRLSPEEMTFDPSFRRSSKGDVSRFHTIPSAADAGTFCGFPPAPDPCDFVACGAQGLCRVVEREGQKVAACACADGTTARTTFLPAATTTSFAKTVSCIDQRLSFLNPGDRNEAGEVLPDPCVGIDCGGHGKCVAMNMTATCECEHGYAADAVVDAQGTRSARCLKPTLAVPDAFYNRRALPRDPSLPVGRKLALLAPPSVSDDDDPVPDGNMMARNAGNRDVGCTVSAQRGTAREAWFATSGLVAVALALVWSRRRRRG